VKKTNKKKVSTQSSIFETFISSQDSYQFFFNSSFSHRYMTLSVSGVETIRIVKSMRGRRPPET